MEKNQNTKRKDKWNRKINEPCKEKKKKKQSSNEENKEN